MDKSRIPNFYKMPIDERLDAVFERGLISKKDYTLLKNQQQQLDIKSADKMIENVIGVMGIPIGLGLNFLINEKEYVIPMAVEEPSIVAALSAAAKISRAGGGFATECSDPILTGQIQVVGIENLAQARNDLLSRKQEIIDLANSFHPRMVARGGGAIDFSIKTYPMESFEEEMLVLNINVNTQDAMGANLVNGMCEGIAPLIESITEGKVFLRILSNLTDQCIAKAKMRIPLGSLSRAGYDSEQIRDGIIIASDFAKADPYRASTHNKGIMNGIDAVALATGNDWRAVEAGAHAYASRHGRYSSLSEWKKDDNGDLVGSIEVPLKVGIVGAPIESNPAVALNLRIMNLESATELSGVMAAVGLAQNFSALKALSTDGIQKGHMTLHARNVVKAANAPHEIFDDVLEELLVSGEIKVWKAKEIVQNLTKKEPIKTDEFDAVTSGKAILLGEHSVVYGRHAIAVPIPLNIRVKVEKANDGVLLMIPSWGVEYRLDKKPEERQSFEKPAALILEKMDLSNVGMKIEVFSDIPRGMGLGGSAVLAVSIIKALNQYFRMELSEQEINAMAFESEKIAHGNPSGIDNTIATYGHPLIYRKNEDTLKERLQIKEPFDLVLAFSKSEGLTAKTVAHVRSQWKSNQEMYEGVFNDIDAIVLKGIQAIQNNDLKQLGELMNFNQGLLNTLQVSTPELERMIHIARDAGAFGAKLTGGGGGGAMIAVSENPLEIIEAFDNEGFKAIQFSVQDSD
ncbi:MAG: hydroxymethylglutaryl-CoA reductase [Gammaproteobacteria bacterium]|nr:hydroxymethylglutaryl-CoA reductase [Gammaproteobacteria bacterium]|tara:strand:+ start:4819 stop:7050 length:2232 start_codon:yes stop_codon:yes gene_type:complete